MPDAVLLEIIAWSNSTMSFERQPFTANDSDLKQSLSLRERCRCQAPASVVLIMRAVRYRILGYGVRQVGVGHNLAGVMAFNKRIKHHSKW